MLTVNMWNKITEKTTLLFNCITQNKQAQCAKNYNKWQP